MARLRSPLLLALAVLLAIEAVGGLVLFFARLAFGRLPGESLHVIAGALLCVVYAAYQWSHWTRVRPFRGRLDHALGLIAAIFMAATNVTGLALGLAWWRARDSVANSRAAAYDPPLSAAHNLGSMVVLTFVAAHVGAVLLRDRRRSRRAPRSTGGS